MNLAAFAVAAGAPLAAYVLAPPERDGRTRLGPGGPTILSVYASAVLLVGGVGLSFTRGKYAHLGPSIALGGASWIALLHIDDRMGSSLANTLDLARKKLYSP